MIDHGYGLPRELGALGNHVLMATKCGKRSVRSAITTVRGGAVYELTEDFRHRSTVRRINPIQWLSSREKEK